MAPIVPTMKYWNTFKPDSPPLFLYFAKLGILVVAWALPAPLKGESKEDDVDTSDTERLWVCRAEQEARTAGN